MKLSSLAPRFVVPIILSVNYVLYCTLLSFFSLFLSPSLFLFCPYFSLMSLILRFLSLFASCLLSLYSHSLALSRTVTQNVSIKLLTLVPTLCKMYFSLSLSFILYFILHFKLNWMKRKYLPT